MKPHSLHYPFSIKLESGDILPELRLHYYTAGKLNHNRDNVIWICPDMLHDGQVNRWWPGMIGPGRLFDTEKYFIIAADLPAGPGLSTGPMSQEPASDYAYLHDFPSISVRDLSSSLELLREHLQIHRLHSLLGFGLGAQIALSWNSEKPELSDHLILLGGGAQLSDWARQQIEIRQQILNLDPTWQLYSRKAGENALPLLEKIIKNNIAGTHQFSSETINDLWQKIFHLPINLFSLNLMQKAGAAYQPALTQVKKVKANTLILLSTNDPWADHAAHFELMKSLPNAEFHFLPSSLGGFAYFEDKDLITRELQAVYLQHYKQKLA